MTLFRESTDEVGAAQRAFDARQDRANSIGRMTLLHKPWERQHQRRVAAPFEQRSNGHSK